MSLPSIPRMALRNEKGSALTHTELDRNFTALRTYIRLLSDLFGVALNADGTLNPNSVGTEQLKDRSVTQAKMSGVNLFIAEDSGVTNSMSISFTPPFTAYLDGMVFWVKLAQTNTGATTLRVDALAQIEVKKLGGTNLEAGDLKIGSVAAFAFFDNKFHLVSGITPESTAAADAISTGFSGIVRYDSPDTAIPADTLSVALAHGLPSYPNYLNVSLVCAVDDIGYVVGDVVSIDQFTEATGLPAFSVTVSDDSVTITTNTAAIESGDFGTITPESWRIRVQASVISPVASQIFPAVTFMVKEPEGVMSDANNLFWMEFGRNNGSKVYTHRLNMSTNVITKLTPEASKPNHKYCNVGKFRRAEGFDDFIYTSSIGAYRLPLLESDPWLPVLQCERSSIYDYKPVWFDEVAGEITHIYCASSSYGTDRVSAILLKDLNVSTTSFTNVGGLALDLTNSGILSADATPGNVQFRAWHQAASVADVLLFQYNPVKKRIYVITNEVGMLHIFQLTATGADPYGPGTTANNLKDWWLYGASRYAVLQYVKSIGIPGDGARWTDSNRDRFFVDFDLTTGTEKALVFSRNGETNFAGSVTRVPWKEA